jgi:hypothetical protein
MRRDEDRDLKWYTVRRSFVEGPCAFLFGLGAVLVFAIRILGG